MITEEERRSIIDQCKEEIILMIPEIVGNALTEKSHDLEVNREFYKKHPKFNTEENRKAVASVLEKLSGQDPLKSSEELANDPETIKAIQERIDTVKKLDTKKVDMNPDRSLTADRPDPDHGEI